MKMRNAEFRMRNGTDTNEQLGVRRRYSAFRIPHSVFP